MAGKNKKFETFLNLMARTRSSNDAEALLAVRKANEFLDKMGLDWETMLRGKTKIANPKANGYAQPQPQPSAQSQQQPPSGTAPPPSGPPSQPWYDASDFGTQINEMFRVLHQAAQNNKINSASFVAWFVDVDQYFKDRGGLTKRQFDGVYRGAKNQGYQWPNTA